jgi:hypothetical protein
MMLLLFLSLLLTRILGRKRRIGLQKFLFLVVLTVLLLVLRLFDWKMKYQKRELQQGDLVKPFLTHLLGDRAALIESEVLLRLISLDLPFF